MSFERSKNTTAGQKYDRQMRGQNIGGRRYARLAE